MEGKAPGQSVRWERMEDEAFLFSMWLTDEKRADSLRVHRKFRVLADSLGPEEPLRLAGLAGRVARTAPSVGGQVCFNFQALACPSAPQQLPSLKPFLGFLVFCISFAFSFLGGFCLPAWCQPCSC